MTHPLWITYAWADNADGDFDYLVSALHAKGIAAKFDRVALTPGQRLWDQISQQITSADLGGWAYLLTPNSIASQPCQEELAYAIERALASKGTSPFPLIGLLHGVPISSVPTALRVRVCVDLLSPTWIESLRAGLENRPPVIPVADTHNFKATPYNAYLGNTALRAVEFSVRFGELRYWRIAYPSLGPKVVSKGIGPSGGRGVSGVHRDYVEGTLDLNGVAMHFFGSGDPISPSTSAYVVFDSAFPLDIAFGWSDEAFGVPAQWWPMKFGP